MNFGLVGYEFMGKAHSNALSHIPMFFDTDLRICKKVLCGRDEAWVRQTADVLGWDEVETDWRRLAERLDIDAVDITAPSNFHKQIALGAAQNGKHIFCEKPLALTLADAREMLAEVPSGSAYPFHSRSRTRARCWIQRRAVNLAQRDSRSRTRARCWKRCAGRA